MPEQVLNEPLSGTEVIEAIVEKVRESLKKDCFLSPNNAYDWFQADVTLKVTANDIGRRPRVERTVIVRSLGDQPATATTAEAAFTMEPEAPNAVREDSGQPVPVLATGADGKPEVKRVTYKKKP